MHNVLRRLRLVSSCSFCGSHLSCVSSLTLSLQFLFGFPFSSSTFGCPNFADVYSARGQIQTRCMLFVVSYGESGFYVYRFLSFCALCLFNNPTERFAEVHSSFAGYVNSIVSVFCFRFRRRCYMLGYFENCVLPASARVGNIPLCVSHIPASLRLICFRSLRFVD